MGLDTSDDAAVYRLTDGIAIVQTIDFFTPIVDDPYTFGQIAAANALSDIYAMGARPILALNIVCFPNCLSTEVLGLILKGGADKVFEAGAVLAGGHSINDDEPKYGLSVTGVVHPEKAFSNAKAMPGDRLLLTKPLGTGIISTAMKASMATEGVVQNAVAVMIELNASAAKAMVEMGASACTDITGFGLLGHSLEMAEASGVSFNLETDHIPILPGVRELAAMGMVPGGAYRNRKHVQGKIKFKTGSDPDNHMAIFDPQTSGGLLISVKLEKEKELISQIDSYGGKAWSIGTVLSRQDYVIKMV